MALVYAKLKVDRFFPEMNITKIVILEKKLVYGSICLKFWPLRECEISRSTKFGDDLYTNVDFIDKYVGMNFKWNSNHANI